MVTAIDRSEVQRLVGDFDAQLVDVLPEPEYTEAHIPGAVSLPLRRLDAGTSTILRRDRPVVVY
jgi:rhodanese-related sulfurtransferase